MGPQGATEAGGPESHGPAHPSRPPDIPGLQESFQTKLEELKIRQEAKITHQSQQCFSLGFGSSEGWP